MGEKMSARRRKAVRMRAWLAMLLALLTAGGCLPALGEDGAKSFAFDLSATAAATEGAIDGTSAFAPVASGSDGLAPAEPEAGEETAAPEDAEAGEDALFLDESDEEDPFEPGGFDGDEPAETDDEPEEPEDEEPEPLGDFAAEEAGEEPGDAVEPEGAEATPEPTKAPVEITITAAGDTTLGGCPRNKTDAKFANVARKKGAKWFLSGVSRIFKKDDLTILNLEGPLTTARSRNKRQYYFFKGSPAYVKILTSGSVEICNVANNHSLDYGKAGLKQTASVLKKAGIGVSGYDVSYTTTVKGVKVCSLGFTKWDHTAADIRKAVKAARKKCDLLIVSVHWGWEKEFKPDKQQRAMGRAAVDAGADLVIGTHSHVYGGIEKYKGKYIVYSLGNFCFGGNPNPTDKRCLIFQQTFSFSEEAGISDAGINIIPAKVSSSKKTNDYRPVLMGRKEGLKLLKSVAKVSSGFSPSNTLWTRSNYLVWSGIVSQKKLNALNASVKRRREKAAARKAKAKDSYDAAALFAEERDASLAVPAEDAPEPEAEDPAAEYIEEGPDVDGGADEAAPDLTDFGTGADPVNADEMDDVTSDLPDFGAEPADGD